LALAKKIVVVGWEGADWSHAQPLLDAGQLPTLALLIGTGCSGPVRGFAPWLPPVSWTTLATGAHPDRHGIHGVAVFDEPAGRPVTFGTAHRRVPALWNYFSAHARSCVVLGWPATYPAEALAPGIMVSDAFAHAPEGPNDPWPVPSGSVSPASRAADLAELRSRPEEIDPGLLGLFIPKLSEIDPALDSRPGWLRQQLSELYTMHNTAVVLCGEGQPDFLTVHFPFIAAVQKKFGVFQSPRHTAAGTFDHAHYADVVSSAYRLQDVLLRDLLNGCSADTLIVVVSAHGIAHGEARPARPPLNAAEYATWCRPHGLLVMKGPGLRTRKTIPGARIEDLAPTLLAWSGLAHDPRLDGRAMQELFSPPPEIAPAHSSVPDSWFPAPVIDPFDSRATAVTGRLLRRLIAQGLVNPLTGSTSEAGRWLQGENAFLLGRALVDLHRTSDALAPLQQAFLAAPESSPRALSLIHCLVRLGLSAEAMPVARIFIDHGEHDSRHRMVRALELYRPHPDAALALLAEVAEPEFAETRRGLERMIFSRLRRHRDVAASFQHSLTQQPGSAELWLGLALAQLRLGEFAAARTSVLRAQALDQSLPQVAGLLEEIETARRTGRVAATPGNRPAPTWLQWTEQAAVRQTLRTALHRRAELFRDARAQTRSTQSPAWSVNTRGDPAPATDAAEVLLSPAGQAPVWSVRPPWPDEQPRILAQFAPALRYAHSAARQWIWVLVAEDPERLAGVVALSVVEDGAVAPATSGRIDLDTREAWVNTPAGDALLSVVIRHAAALGLVSLDLQTRTNDATDTLLRRHGFAEVIRHEVWTVPIPGAIASLQTHYGRILKRWPLQIQPLRHEHVEIARQICERTGLLASDKVVLKSKTHPRGIDPAVSFVAGPPDQPVAILLASIDGTRVEVEIVARNPGVPTTAPAAVPALMLQFLLVAHELGFNEARCSLRPALTPNLASLMTTWSGRCEQRQAAFRLKLAAPSG